MDSTGKEQIDRWPQFGATNSDDVRLQIFGPNREEYEGNPLRLHSQTLQTLQALEFFKSLLSERWSSDIRPFEIEKQSVIREAVGRFIAENLQEDESSGIAEMYRHIILEEFKANIAIAMTSNTEKNLADEEHSYFALLWPFALIERSDGTTIIFPFQQGLVFHIISSLRLPWSSNNTEQLH
ncbi:hypothetical protein SUGI_1479090 [Cryptomeria japonica]|uniref:Uncharacterized protein n=1 Tax=Cryptomeria japonica TaxID=3369 RepID=A0AAD3NTP3_CRYJA|nr:hypothetical protein SUGI_1479090 [Cryptomeria japonica]